MWAAPCLALLILFLLAPAPVLPKRATRPALISLDADSTYVNGILQILANRGGLNIVTSPEVQRRKISIHLRNTPFDEALNLVVRAAGMGYERVGNSILVGDVQKLSTPTGLVTRVFELQYANASEVKTMLEVLSKDVSANAVGNRLMIHASQSVVDEAATIIEQLDRKPQQVMLEARLVEVNKSDVKELGIDWEKITKWNTVLTEGDQGASAQGQLPQNLGYFKAGETADCLPAGERLSGRAGRLDHGRSRQASREQQDRHAERQAGPDLRRRDGSRRDHLAPESRRRCGGALQTGSAREDRRGREAQHHPVSSVMASS